MTFELAYPLCAAAGGLLAAIAIALLWRRRTERGWTSTTCLAAACVFAAMAAGMPRVSFRDGETVQVLVDLSASTRSADYRDRTKLHARLHELIPGYRYTLRQFGENEPRTRLPPIAQPTILFSDGQFPVATSAEAVAAPVVPVIDPALTNARDARIVDLLHERGRTIAITQNNGPPRTLHANGQSFAIPSGRQRVDVGSAYVPTKVALNSADDWPENDSMQSPPAAPVGVQRWCVGAQAPAGFERLALADLPADAEAYLSTALLVIDAGDAARFDTAQQHAIATWVRDLGGSLLIIGADAAWADMRGTAIEALSPLSVDPPVAKTQWIVLVDASGSMAQVEAGTTKWQDALSAAAAAAKALPPRDDVRLGAFAADLRWWQSAPASEIVVSPPAGQSPHGPTNLEAALKQVLTLPPATNRQILLLTDAEIELPSVQEMGARLRSASTAVSCLALSDGRGMEALRALTTATGGRFVAQSDPGAWAKAARELAGKLAPARWHGQPLELIVSTPLPPGNAIAQGWNSAWPREKARVFARAADGADNSLAATWHTGLGQVTTAAWPASLQQLSQLVPVLEHEPNDDRYRITWPDKEPLLRIIGPAQKVVLNLTGPGGSQAIEAPRVAPDVYELPWTAPSEGADAAITADDHTIATRAFPLRYPQEFDAIGVNRPNLQRLAAESGGAVIEPGNHEAIHLAIAPRIVGLAPWLGATAVLLTSVGLLALRRRL